MTRLLVVGGWAARTIKHAEQRYLLFAVAGRRPSPPSLHPRPVPVGAAH